jgi:tetratricopeptide (TPR) repeat protein
VRAFDVEEAKAIIKTNPKYLSLNEMYLVARTYPEGSREFNEVFDIATRLFPGEPVAIVNASAVDIETGNFRVALERLLKVADRKDALNNLGVAYARMGQYDKARKCFEEAISSGDELAEHNLKELSIVEEQSM